MAEQMTRGAEPTLKPVTIPPPSAVSSLRPMLEGLARLHDAVLLVDRAGAILWRSAGLARLGVHDDAYSAMQAIERSLPSTARSPTSVAGSAIAGIQADESFRGSDGELPVELSVTRGGRTPPLRS